MYLPKLPILKVGERAGSRSQQQSTYLECGTIQSLIPNVLFTVKKKANMLIFPTKYSNMDKHGYKIHLHLWLLNKTRS